MYLSETCKQSQLVDEKYVNQRAAECSGEQLSLDVLTKCLRAHALGKFPGRSEDKYTRSWHLSSLDENLRTDNYLHLTCAPYKTCGVSFRRQHWSIS